MNAVPVRVIEASQRVYDYKSLAEEVRVSQATLYRAVRDGQLACLRIGRRVLFTDRHVQAWLRSAEQRASG